MMKIPLHPGDYVIAAFPFKNQVFIVTKYGSIFRMRISEIDGLPIFELAEEK